MKFDAISMQTSPVFKMAVPTKISAIFQNFSNYLARTSSFKSKRFKFSLPCCGVNRQPASTSIHTSATDRDLTEFFDEEKNWGESVVKVGRSWRVPELRIKSNEDLHKLWYVLLKERNMLLTMAHAYKQEAECFPNPERIDKVEESMENLETVVKERNQAYHELEIGSYREVPKPDRSTPFRHLFCREAKEYAVPQHANEQWQRERVEMTQQEAAVFVKMMSRKLHDEKLRAIRRQRNHVQKLLKRFSDADEEAIKTQYPDADLVKIKRKLCQRHHQ